MQLISYNAALVQLEAGELVTRCHWPAGEYLYLAGEKNIQRRSAAGDAAFVANEDERTANDWVLLDDSSDLELIELDPTEDLHPYQIVGAVAVVLLIMLLVALAHRLGYIK